MMKKIALALFAAALAMPALAADPAPSDQHYSKPKKPHLICKRDDSTGSHMAKSVCKTAEEWAGTSVDSDHSKLGIVTHAQAGGSGIVPTGD
jgi:hypothetical protein